MKFILQLHEARLPPNVVDMVMCEIFTRAQELDCCALVKAKVIYKLILANYFKYFSINTSAICTLFNAAPLRTLSATTHISMPFS